MNERWQEIEQIYHRALELDGSARAEFLARTCDGDPALRAEVESLLAHGDQAGSYLETPPVEMAAKALGKGDRSPAASNAALEPGTMIAHYRVTASLGAGGMGEVYRARDTKLQRDVALKILPQAMARDRERMARFEREAQVLASLNHPNIAAIYGLEESNGIRALAMELVEGATLAEKIVGEGSALPREPKGLPYPDALSMARQLAEALEYAHERGVIHRDLKPANVKITPEGTVKVLDFGLAKVLSGMGASPVHGQDTHATDQNSPTLSMTGTEPGMILGTAAYMSPQQAKGLNADRRCDIWAFGCVLYEMLSGRKAFEGETISEVLVAVLTKEPDLAALPATTPQTILQLIRRCLQKDLRQRLQAIGEARIAIEEELSGTGVPPVIEHGQDAHATRATSPLRRALPWLLAAVAVVALAGWWRANRNAAPSPGWSGELLSGPTIAFFPRVSPDGRLIAFQAMVDNIAQVAVMDRASGNWTVLTHDRTHGPTSSSPSWSHDGSRIFFDRIISQPVGIYSVPSLGGEERLLLANAASPQALPDGTMLVVRVDPDRRNQIYHFWPDTGRLQALGAWVDFHYSAPIRIFPTGKEAVFFGGVKEEEPDHLYLLNIATGTARRLAPELVLSSSYYSGSMFPLAVTPGGESVLIDLPSGNLHRIVAIPRSGASPVRTLMTLTSLAWSLDASPDGSIYVDQVERPLEMLRLPQSGGTPEVLATSETYTQYDAAPIEFADGRFLLPTLNAGQLRLLLGKPGGSFVPLVETAEETAPPMVQLGNDELALMVGSPPARTLSIASIKEGRIIRRFKQTEGKQIDSVAASTDGKSLYYASSGAIWSISSGDGNPSRICDGDSVAVDPNGRSLIVNLIEQQHVRLETVPLSGGPPEEIRLRDDLPLTPNALGSNGINKDRKLLVGVAPADSWFWGLGIFDLATKKLRQVPVKYACDVVMPAWARDGNILLTAFPMRTHIWRFRPAR